MAIDLDTTEGRKKYLSEKLDDLLDGINDSIKDAKELIKLIKPFRAKINLIPFNPWPGSKYRVSSPEKIQEFKKYILEKGELVATVRLPRGDDVLAACGQLKSF